MQYDEASKYLWRNSNSFNRLPVLIALHDQMASAEWLRLLGECWSCCDNIGRHRLQLKCLLPSSGPVLEMMTLEERELYQTLPEQFEIFRGCGPDNMEGACWSLDPDVASRFPTLHRYQQTEPLLVTAIVQREQVLAVKLDRQEAEIITFYAKRVEVAELEAW